MYLSANSKMKGRFQLLLWLNELLQVHVQQIQNLSDGICFCGLIYLYSPQSIKLSRLKLTAVTEWEKTQNLKVLAQGIETAGLKKKFDVTQAIIQFKKLADGKFKEILELLQWVKKIFDDPKFQLSYQDLNDLRKWLKNAAKHSQEKKLRRVLVTPSKSFISQSDKMSFLSLQERMIDQVEISNTTEETFSFGTKNQKRSKSLNQSRSQNLQKVSSAQNFEYLPSDYKDPSYSVKLSNIARQQKIEKDENRQEHKAKFERKNQLSRKIQNFHHKISAQHREEIIANEREKLLIENDNQQHYQQQYFRKENILKQFLIKLHDNSPYIPSSWIEDNTIKGQGSCCQRLFSQFTTEMWKRIEKFVVCGRASFESKKKGSRYTLWEDLLILLVLFLKPSVMTKNQAYRILERYLGRKFQGVKGRFRVMMKSLTAVKMMESLEKGTVIEISHYHLYSARQTE